MWFYTFQESVSEIKCTDCGKTTMVPFKPTVGKPVYCKTCFSKHFKRPESVGKNSSFDPKQAWARRGDGWRGRKEKPANVFKQVWRRVYKKRYLSRRQVTERRRTAKRGRRDDT